MLDREQPAGPQQSGGQHRDGLDEPHAVGAAEQCTRWIMLGHFGFQFGAIGDVWRVGDDGVHRAVELGEEVRAGDVGRDHLDGGSRGVAARELQRRRGVLDGEHAGARPRVRQRDRERARTGAQVDDHRRLGGIWKVLAQHPVQQRLGLGPRNEHAGTDVEYDGPEGCGGRQVLQRNSTGTRRDEFAVALEERGLGLVEHQPTAVDPGDVGGQLLGVDAGRIDTRRREHVDGLCDRLPDGTRADPRTGRGHVVHLGLRRRRIMTPAASPACRRRRARRAPGRGRRRAPDRGCAP